jgi:hypothetical protein
LTHSEDAAENAENQEEADNKDNEDNDAVAVAVPTQWN